MHEFRIEYLSAIPTTAVDVQHGKTQIILCPGKSTGLGIDLIREFQPYEMFEMEWLQWTSVEL